MTKSFCQPAVRIRPALIGGAWLEAMDSERYSRLDRNGRLDLVVPSAMPGPVLDVARTLSTDVIDTSGAVLLMIRNEAREFDNPSHADGRE